MLPLSGKPRSGMLINPPDERPEAGHLPGHAARRASANRSIRRIAGTIRPRMVTSAPVAGRVPDLPS